MYDLLRIDDEIVRYEMRLGNRTASTAQGLREQAEQLGVLGTPDVTVIVPAYDDLVSEVRPDGR